MCIKKQGRILMQYWIFYANNKDNKWPFNCCNYSHFETALSNVLWNIIHRSHYEALTILEKYFWMYKFIGSNNYHRYKIEFDCKTIQTMNLFLNKWNELRTMILRMSLETELVRVKTIFAIENLPSWMRIWKVKFDWLWRS